MLVCLAALELLVALVGTSVGATVVFVAFVLCSENTL